MIGTGQNMNSSTARDRSAAFPFEIPYRLINMFSVKGDMVLDPFVGTGTTLKASAVAARNSLGFDLDAGLQETVFRDVASLPERSNEILSERLQRHRAFIGRCSSNGRALKYMNKPYQLPVVTRQETDLFFNPITSAQMIGEDALEVTYTDKPHSA